MSDDDEFSDPPAGASRASFPLLEPPGPGTYELPRCTAHVAVLTEDDCFLLRVELEGTGQVIFVPLPYEAARGLAGMANHLVEQYPSAVSGETTH
jgi:hypothetical protein